MAKRRGRPQMITGQQDSPDTAPEPVASGNNGGKSWKTWIQSLTCVAAMVGIGLLIGWWLLGAAQANQACSAGGRSASWAGIQISGLPGSLQSSFGYGRGTQLIESTLTARARPGLELPPRIPVLAEPLTSVDGTQVIPALSDAASSPSQ